MCWSECICSGSYVVLRLIIFKQPSLLFRDCLIKTQYKHVPINADTYNLRDIGISAWAKRSNSDIIGRIMHWHVAIKNAHATGGGCRILRKRKVCVKVMHGSNLGAEFEILLLKSVLKKVG
jgi:hypothetical protein